jgi:hypothetical protein
MDALLSLMPYLLDACGQGMVSTGNLERRSARLWQDVEKRLDPLP